MSGANPIIKPPASPAIPRSLTEPPSTPSAPTKKPPYAWRYSVGARLLLLDGGPKFGGQSSSSSCLYCRIELPCMCVCTEPGSSYLEPHGGVGACSRTKGLCGLGGQLWSETAQRRSLARSGAGPSLNCKARRERREAWSSPRCRSCWARRCPRRRPSGC